MRRRSARGPLPFLAGLLALAGLLLVGLPGPNLFQDREGLAQRAAAALAAGSIEEAEVLAGRLLALQESIPALTLIGEVRLRRLDPAGAERAFARALGLAPGHQEARLGLGRALLELLRPEEGLALAREVRGQEPDDPRAWSLEVRCLLDLGRADEALVLSEQSLARFPDPTPDLLAARGAALFRGRRVSESALAYQEALRGDPLLLEAHLRLGSGLLIALPSKILSQLPGQAELEAGHPERAIPLLIAAFGREHPDPRLHRLLGEALQSALYRGSFLGSHPATGQLRALLPDPGPGGVPLQRLFPSYASLSPERRTQVHRACALWSRYLPGLIRAGGRHDLLERAAHATDAADRARLKGRKTTDGRYWDHVRGLGGLHAATGVEALDQAGACGFNTLAHELTHQVHLFVMGQAARTRILELYRAALANGRCLDYYAATCAEEYLAQGAEAFVSLAKRPDCRRTHGHTRFGLLARDPGLEEFLRRNGSWDPLAGPGRAALLEAAAEYALLAGRPAEALAALGLIDSGLPVHAADLRDQALRELGGPLPAGP